MQFISVDLGSTNIKAAVYDDDMHCISCKSIPMIYDRSEGFVEFDVTVYCKSLVMLLADIVARSGVDSKQITQIVFTGQAESLVMLGSDKQPVMNAISWMDERSILECTELAKIFDKGSFEAITGQQAILPTWPATKILWLKNNRTDIFEKTAYYIMLKDYVCFFLAGKMQAECSIATFSFYFDIYNKCYWTEMLNAIGIKESQLPPLVEPCSIVGTLTEENANSIGLNKNTKVNNGTLDHFAGMIGTGNVNGNAVNLSMGTVMGLSMATSTPWKDKNIGIPMHYGYLPGTYIMLPVAESGGVCLEWLQQTCIKTSSFKEIDTIVASRNLHSDIIFLPYLMGTNAPEYDSSASGLFYGLRVEHDVFDMAAAVMEGVAFLLKKNCELLKKKCGEIEYVISTGGGAKSDIWCQIQADITNIPIITMHEKEAACFGAAIIAAVNEGVFTEYSDASGKLIHAEKRYTPQKSANYESSYKKFCALYDAAVSISKIK